VTSCLVTGGAGFIGSHLVEGLLDAGGASACSTTSHRQPRKPGGTDQSYPSLYAAALPTLPRPWRRRRAARWCFTWPRCPRSS